MEIPENAAYRKTAYSRAASGNESRMEYFYDDHDHLVRLVNTSMLEENPAFPAPVIDFAYEYNADGTIAVKTTSGDNPFGKVTVEKFIYSSGKKADAVYKYENNRSVGGLSYEYDSHGNPVKVYYIYDGKIVHPKSECEYIYDECGNISYRKEMFGCGEMIVSDQTWFEYDEFGNISLEKKLQHGADSPELRRFFYDKDHRLIKVEHYMEDRLFVTTVYQYEYY